MTPEALMQLQMSTPSTGLANKSSVEITFLIKHSLQIAGGMDFLCWKHNRSSPATSPLRAALPLRTCVPLQTLHRLQKSLP